MADILAYYICDKCVVTGADPKEPDGTVLCWNCGDPVPITGHVYSVEKKLKTTKVKEVDD